MDIMKDETAIIDDTKCVLLEFEDETVAVGYLNWLTSHNNENDIRDVIEKRLDVIIRWPNCAIGPASKMRRALQKCNEWMKYVVKIVSYGDWTTMCNQLSTYIKCDDPNPGKHERKLHSKRKIDESEDENENNIKKSLKKEKKEITKLRFSAKNTTGCTILQKLKTGNKDYKTEQTRYSTSSNDEGIVELQKTQDVQKLMLVKQSKQLEEVNKRLKYIVDISEAIKRVEKKVDNISNAMMILESSLKCRSDVNNVMKFVDNDIGNDIMVLPLLDKIKTDGSYISEEMKDDQFQKNTPIIFHVANTEMDEITSEANNHPSDLASSSKMDAKKINSKIIDVEPTISKICNNAAELNGCHYFGNRLVTKAQLAKLNDSSVSKMTCDLITIVFDKKELKESSLTGQKANANKNKDATKKLDPHRVAAVEEYVYKKFGKTDDNIKLFRGAVRTKCNNAKKITNAINTSVSTADK